MPPNLWFRLLVGFVALSAVTLGAMYVIGGRLPETQSASATVSLDLTPEETFGRLADFERYPRSSLSVLAVERDDDVNGLPEWREHMSQSTITWRTLVWDPPHRMVQRGVDSVVPQSTLWTFELTPEGDGTRLDVTIETTVSAGTWHVPIFRLLLKLGGTRVALEGYLVNTLPDFDADALHWH
ncbi:MAG: SRPBCC family protein [Planctomycetota bacterium]